LLGYVTRYRRAFLLGFACVITTTAITLAGPWVLKYAIDDLTANATAANFRFYAVALLALSAFGGVFRFLMRRIIIGASRDIEYDLRNDFFAALQRLEPSFFHRRRTGDLMSRATNDLGSVRQMIGPAVMYTSTTAITFFVAIAMMLSIDPWLTAVALIPLPFVSIVVYYFGELIHRRFLLIQEQLSEISAVAQENLSGVRVVRAYAQEPFEIERFRAANEEYVRRNRRLIAVQGMYFPSMGLLMGVAMLIVLWLGSRAVVAQRMTVGELVAFNAYLVMLSWPMIAFGWVTNLIQRGMASWKRMLEVLDAVPAINDDDVPETSIFRLKPEATGAGEQPEAEHQAVVVASGFSRKIQEIRGDIEFRNLTFKHADTVILDGVSAVIPAGTTTAIVGATGSGKSTLLHLLPRLHNPPPGTVFVDGVDVRQIPLELLRGAIGFVPQEPFLFSATIADNIAFGARNGQDGRNRIEEAAAVARLDKDLGDFPKGYDTIVGERGITLSGGQKQRTAIARAIVVDPRILVLDDALSAVDTYTEEEILGRLGGVLRQRTAIIVSHRISTVRAADQILVIDGGRIVERGTHDELVSRDGPYAELYRKQLLEEELAAS
ncbi:MAG TPA: ABC transporter ATP-binding protein, partial [Vicinamibacterales bacterium]